MWLQIAVVALLLGGVSAFGPRASPRTRMLARMTGRRAKDMYGQFTDPLRRQRRVAGEQGGPGETGGRPAHRADGAASAQK